MKKIILILAITCGIGSASAQSNSRAISQQRIISPYNIEVTYDKTVHIIFPSGVKYVDLGSPVLIAGKADGTENVVRIKAARRNFEQDTNFSVITEDGSFYAFNVAYSKTPTRLSIEMCDFKQNELYSPQANNTIPIYLRELGDEAPMLVNQIMAALWKNNKRYVRGVKSNEFRMLYALRSVYIHNGLLYLHTEIKNGSNVPFDVDFITFKIVDKKITKRTAIAEETIQPLRTYNEMSYIAGKTLKRTVYCFEKFTIPDNKVLRIELHEKRGGRHHTLTIKNSHIVDAKTIKKLNIK